MMNDLLGCKANLPDESIINVRALRTLEFIERSALFGVLPFACSKQKIRASLRRLDES
jgi:hypothetical protein